MHLTSMVWKIVAFLFRPECVMGYDWCQPTLQIWRVSFSCWCAAKETGMRQAYMSSIGSNSHLVEYMASHSALLNTLQQNRWNSSALFLFAKSFEKVEKQLRNVIILHIYHIRYLNMKDMGKIGHCLIKSRHNTVWTICIILCMYCSTYPDSKVHGANMGPIWGRH